MAEISNYVIDLLLAGVFIAVVAVSAKRGFFKSIFSAVSWLLSAFAAAKLNDLLSQWVYDHLIEQRLISAVGKRLTGTLSVNETASYARGLIDNIPGLLIRAAQTLGVDVNFLAGEYAQSRPRVAEIVPSLVDTVARPVVMSVLNVFNFFLLFAVLLGVFRLLLRKTEEKREGSLLQSGDKLLGGVLGAVKGAVLVVLLAVLLHFIVGFSEGSALERMVENSTIISKIAAEDFIQKVFRVA